MATWFQSVVFDAHDPAALAEFWSQALGWPITFSSDDEVDVGPAGTSPDLVFGRVPEPKSGPNPIHLDLASASFDDQAATVARLRRLGATPIDVGQGPDVAWVVLADPEGNELCVLEPRDTYAGTGPLAAVVCHVSDPEALAPFWSAALGWAVVVSAPGLTVLRAADGTGPFVELIAWAEPPARGAKNRVHLDVAPFAAGDQAAEVARLEALGARRADVGQGPGVTWVVLADPEGNELCVLSARDPGG